MGWLLFKPDPTVKGNFPIICFLTGYLLPAVVAHLGWEDGLGGLLYAGILRALLFQQSTYCVNSLAHYFGDQPYSDASSPRDHTITAVLTFGEGYHNFHHEFPSDYRNGVKWFSYDPTKWCIAIWAWLGLASRLQRFDENEINKAIVLQKQKRVELAKKGIHWGVPIEQLPVYSWEEMESLCSEDGVARQLICIAGIIYDIHSFSDSHPGGKHLLSASVGKDITAKFHGGLHHPAHNLLDNLRFGVLRHGGKIEN
ncbi:hypothetical protein NQ176_g4660 [Zarea fungicola]|uniref:Uncharacterized protein n=1 Tax=Zarea fungicola TaxID=93591 RepID=A0ACC1NDD0_9HYPO|nr:hypothetical protein NQ176_g4660 [Lecanicillium fungicola]